MSRTLFVLALVSMLAPAVRADEPTAEPQRVVDLRGAWRFHLGDLATPPDKMIPAAWDAIFAPAAWEDEGYWGYDGYAWYARAFTLPASAARQPLTLRLGRIDDVDEVWVNGQFVGGTGRMPPRYETAYQVDRAYRVPARFLVPDGPNVVTVRVYDRELSGGMLGGPIGLYTRPEEPRYVLDLAGPWRFQPGDGAGRTTPAFDDRQWDTIAVPGRWEPQGYDLDGPAWYRIRFDLPRGVAPRDAYRLVLGKIDDLDTAYLNGQAIGATDSRGRPFRLGDDQWQRLRAYPVPEGLLKPRDNVLAVRVWDGGLDGGIYEGPVGLLTERDFRTWRREPAPDEDDRSLWQRWLDHWLGN
jgi:sialate O-acetylesterase